MKHGAFWAVAVWVGVWAAALGLQAAEAEGAKTTLPAEVEKAVAAAVPDAVTTEFQQRDDEGAVVFEVEVNQGGKEYNLSVTPDGTVLTVRSQEYLKELAPAVAAVVAEAVRGGKVTEIEKREIRAERRHGQVTAVQPPKLRLEISYLQGETHGTVSLATDKAGILVVRRRTEEVGGEEHEE